ncbi:signal recognition particle, SRP9/SRP14 subunit [Dioszegia hungarica]|uniref:Signal recognition particle, SRP9/SRP14 subunit n=1 Tax=Dioszegia hungarica TaxID=4972 RepID=A0AA38HCD0_9TREE|nr:signal recognition particle, SRP9/SRP14 subunit [Dioszegia hungarica]KAI9636949.1 signal recognition particle, SRP9/SRP14 subunit [Dioszegia hungarica]
MVYIKNWTEFETAATGLYAKSPNTVRYCVKFRPKTGMLVLKLTDNVTCIMYKTFSSIILNRFETLNLRLLSQIANLPRPSISAVASTSLLAPPAENAGRAGTPMMDEAEGRERAGTPAVEAAAAGKGAGGAGAGGATGSGTGSGGGAGGKKKKKGKR